MGATLHPVPLVPVQRRFPDRSTQKPDLVRRTPRLDLDVEAAVSFDLLPTRLV